LNFTNFGQSKGLDYRVYGKISQRFSNDNKNSKIKSANYTLMVDFSKTMRDSYDSKHQYDIFNYGHVGTFKTRRTPSYEFNDNLQRWEHNGFRDLEVEFTPSETNAALASITTQYYNLSGDMRICSKSNKETH
jgi:hypothetical protein